MEATLFFHRIALFKPLQCGDFLLGTFVLRPLQQGLEMLLPLIHRLGYMLQLLLSDVLELHGHDDLRQISRYLGRS